MKRGFFAIILCIGAVAGLATHVGAQTRLIHYWNFNRFTPGRVDTISSGGCAFPVTTPNRTLPYSADYSIIDTAKAKIWYTRQPGVTTGYPQSSIYSICFTFQDSSTGGSLINAQLGATGGNYFRERNPSDSMQLLFYIPTTNYQNINVAFACQNSSTTSGPTYLLYDYSLDSGATWQSTGLSKLKDSAWSSAFNLCSVAITDPLANNNRKLVLRVRDSLHNNGSSGNLRYDNVTVSGDTILPGGSLVHFWDFNTMTGAYGLFPVCGTTAIPFPILNADYTIHPSSNAYVTMKLMPGATFSPATNPVYLDEVASVVADFDTVNSNWAPLGGAVPGSIALRPRNPLDSVYLYYYMPTTNYKNITLTYASQTSSFSSGDSVQVFNYSVDSGATWRLAGISEPLDSAALTYKKISVAFTDPAANNCSTLFFRIAFVGRSKPNAVCPAAPSGNNRFDNISVQGDSILSSLPTITTTPATYGPFCSTASSPLSVAFTTTGAIAPNYAVQITNANGTFPVNTTSNIIGTGSASPIAATIPAGVYAPGSLYRVRVVSSYPVTYGSDNGSNFILTGGAGPISGPAAVCLNSTAALTETTGGTWSSSNTSAVTVGSSTGIISGVAFGTAIITFNTSGCLATTTINVNPVPAAIAGANTVCIGQSTTLTDATALGTWSGSGAGTATVGSASGSVTGVSAGTVIISYTLATGCFSSRALTVNPLPSAITGATVLCQGSNTTLNDLTAGGTWSSSNTSQATVGSSSGIVTGIGGGTPIIVYTSNLGCIATTTLTVNPTPSPILGSPNGCVGATTSLTDLTAFGAWSSSNTLVASIGSSTGVMTGITVGTSIISYTLSTGCLITQTVAINSLPAGITGVTTFCAGAGTTLSNTTSGGSWSSSNTAIASVGSTGIVTSISGAGGNPVISYNLLSGCSASVTLSVNPAPAPVSGSTTIYCIGVTTTLSDAGSGTWTSDNTSVATIGSSSGTVTSVAPGAANITYTLPDGCYISVVETVNPSAAPITGPAGICTGSTHYLTDETAFGVWVSGNSAVATIGSGSGIITGVAPGTVIITYGLSLACTTTSTVTVNPLPLGITGTTSVCAGLTTPLSDLSAGGTWSSSVPVLGSVDLLSGVVTGLIASEIEISYTLPTGCGTFTTFTINPVPATITGTMNVCTGLTTNLVETTTGGSWLSGDISTATVGSTGMVTGLNAGSAIVSYELPTGCIATAPVTVNPLPLAIGGATSVCMGLTASLTDPSPGGTWSSGDVSLATIVSGTGVATGVAPGSPVITYTLPTGCITTTVFTVNPRYAISGSSIFCTGLSTLLTDVVAGGTWTSSNTTVATIGSSSGMLNSLIPGNTTVTYALPTGCTVSENVTVISLPDPISGTTGICKGLTSTLTDAGGGGWYSSDPSVATIGFGTGVVTGITPGSAIITYSLGTSCINTTVVTINPLPNAITGIAPVCQSAELALTDTATGGTWSSSNTSVAAIGSASGIVSGVSAGNTVIVYTLPTGCIATNTVTVNPIMPVSGLSGVCQGLTTPLSDAVAGGTWTSSNAAAGTVDAGTGVVTGIAPGNTVIAYTLPTGCFATTTVTVNPLASITGTAAVCAGLTTPLANMNTGGTWTSSNTSISNVDASTGMVTGVTAGADTIAYTLPTGCMATTLFTVNPLPSIIGGTASLCVGLTYSFTDSASGGTWSSSNTAIAAIGSTSGSAIAAATGAANLVYTLPTGCLMTKAVVVNASPADITGIPAVCIGGTTALSDTGSGTWSSSNMSVATIGSTTGIATGDTAGLSVIVYTLPDGCTAATVLTVNAIAPATGVMHVCDGLTTTLSDIVSGGTWSSSNTSVATVAISTGVVRGRSAGTVTIAYTLPTGCTTSGLFTVNATPAVYTVSGGGSYCAGGTGLNIDLSGSQAGVSYQLFDTVSSGAPVVGTGSSLVFGPHTAAGTYTIAATDTATSCIADMSGFATITIIPNVTPSVSLAGNIGDTVCPGQLLTYTATPVNGGTSPDFFWKLNGAATFVSVDVYNVLPHNGDVVKVYMVSHAVCASPDTVSRSVTITVDSVYVPSVSIAAAPGTNIKPGQSDTLTAVISGAGPNPSYRWYVNSNPVAGSTSSVFISHALNNGDTVWCNVRGTGLCGAQSSSYVIMNVSNLGLAQIAAEGHLTLFPNPNTGTFTLKGSLSSTADQEVTVEITDMLGQTIYKNTLNTHGGNIDEQIVPGNKLANGMYMLVLKSDAGNDVFHFVVGR